MTDHRLMGLHEIAAHFAISRQLAAKWSQRSDFPPPIAELAQGRVWDRSEILAWARKHGRRKGAGPASI